ncbi:MAG TPA: hypothetical protein VGC99_28880 [Candidatus Tectomicrobia bacterium]
MAYGAAFCLTDAQEAYDIHAHERHLVQVQHYPGATALHEGL